MVYIVKAGATRFDDPVYVADKTNGLTIEWVGDTLTIRSEEARSFKKSHTWKSKDNSHQVNIKYDITVELPQR